jgi:hypothetical protein
MTFSITTLSMKGLFVTRSITALCIKCHYAECRDLFVMLNAVMLSIVLLSVVLLSVVAPFSLIISHSFYSW